MLSLSPLHASVPIHPMHATAVIATFRLEDLKPGLRHELDVPLTPELLHQFATCSGDVSPIHVSRDEAAARGFPGCVAHGMLLGALLSRIVGCHLPGRHALLMTASFQFHKPCLEGETVRVEAAIEEVSPATRTVTMSFRFRVKDELRARATALVGLST